MAEPMFKVNGKEYPLAQNLTLGEMCDAERYFDVEFGETATAGVRMAAALLWVSIKRVDDSVTVDEVRALPPDVFTSLEEQKPADPTTGGESEKSATSGEPLSSGSDGQDSPLRAIGAQI